MSGGGIDSKWWYGVAGPAAMVLVGSQILRVGSELFGLPSGNADPKFSFVIAGLLFVGTGLFLIPLFAYCAYKDATAVSNSAAEWDPDPRFWGIAGLVVPIAGLAAGVSGFLTLFVAVSYLYKRFTTPVVAVVWEDGGDGADKPNGSQSPGSRPNNRDGQGRSEPPRKTGGDREGVYDGTVDRQEGVPARDDRRSEPAAETESAPKESSKWWYGVAGVVFFDVITILGLMAGRYMGLNVTEFAGQTQIGFVGRGLLILSFFGTIGAFIMIPLALVFTVSMLADVRRLRRACAGWRPNRLVWGAVSVAHPVAAAHLVTSGRPTISMLAALAGSLIYLVLRHIRVGRP